MAQAAGDLARALLNPIDPCVEVEFAVGVYVTASEPAALAVDAGEVGLAADPGAVSAIERVIPDVQLPVGGSIDRRNEVARAVGDVDDVLVGANAVHLG